MSSYYEVLEIPETASADEIKRAWAKKVRIHSPDKDPEGNRKISEAKAVLLDPSAREDYDAQLKYGDEIQDLFEEGYFALFCEDYKTACNYFQEILALHPNNLDARNQLSVALFRNGKEKEGISQQLKLSQLAPNSALYAKNLGDLYHIQFLKSKSWDSYGSARASYERAIELESYNSSHHKQLALLYIRGEDYANAEQTIENGIVADGKTDIDDLDLMIVLADVYLLTGRKHLVAKLAERVKSVIPDDEEARKYAAYSFIRKAVELFHDHGLYDLAAIFVTSAKHFGADLSEEAEALQKIERAGTIQREIERLVEDKSIEPVIIKMFLVTIGCRWLGEDIEDDTIEKLVEAAQTWSKFELANAVAVCRKKYPTLTSVLSSQLDSIVQLGYGSSFANPGSSYAPRQTTSTAGSGCVIPIMMTVSILIFLLSQ